MNLIHYFYFFGSNYYLFSNQDDFSKDFSSIVSEINSLSLIHLDIPQTQEHLHNLNLLRTRLINRSTLHLNPPNLPRVDHQFTPCSKHMQNFEHALNRGIAGNYVNKFLKLAGY